MLFLLLCALFAVVLLCSGWYLYENRWDRRLFQHPADANFGLNVRARKAATLWRERELLPLDVRPAADFLAEHLPGAVNAPFSEGEIEEEALKGIARDRPLLVYCDGGYRSRQSIPSLRKAGFTSIYHLHRGILSWKIAKEPTEAGPPA